MSILKFYCDTDVCGNFELCLSVVFDFHGHFIHSHANSLRQIFRKLSATIFLLVWLVRRRGCTRHKQGFKVRCPLQARRTFVRELSRCYLLIPLIALYRPFRETLPVLFVPRSTYNSGLTKLNVFPLTSSTSLTFHMPCSWIHILRFVVSMINDADFTRVWTFSKILIVWSFVNVHGCKTVPRIIASEPSVFPAALGIKALVLQLVERTAETSTSSDWILLQAS